jgi:hypothetical protein
MIVAQQGCEKAIYHFVLFPTLKLCFLFSRTDKEMTMDRLHKSLLLEGPFPLGDSTPSDTSAQLDGLPSPDNPQLDSLQFNKSTQFDSSPPCDISHQCLPVLKNATTSHCLTQSTSLDKADNLSQLYKPLDPSKHEIRLLRILPSSGKATTIHCELETTTLDAQPRYQALSYEWNPPGVVDSSAKVLVNGQQVPLTANLRHALARLRRGPSCMYWVDALCINQSDKQERGHQVQFMREIYQQARRVVVWLGLDRGTMSLGMGLLEDLASNEAFWFSNEAGQKLVLGSLLNPQFRPRWESVIQILRNSYWSRSWIIQELVVASDPDIRLLCDSESTSLQVVSQLYNYMYIITKSPSKLGYDLAYQFYSFGWTATTVTHHRQGLRRGRGPPQYDISLLENLRNYSNQKCQNPRDKVYALLGISTQSSRVEFPVSYNEPISKVFRNAAKFIIEDSQQLDILLECYLDSHRPLKPSWAPDWEHYDMGLRTIYHNAEDWNASPHPVSEIIILKKKILRVKGCLIGEINGIAESFESCQSLLAASSRNWLKFALSILQPSSEPEKSSSSHQSVSSTSPNSISKPHPPKHVWDAALEALYNALVRTARTKELASTIWSFSKFRTYFEQIRDGDDLSPESRSPIAGLGELSNVASLLDLITWKRLCSIQCHSAQSMGPLDSEDESLCIHQSRTVGLCPDNANEGDVITVIRGCKYPLVLRRDEKGYMIVNHAYVYGFMNGEVLGRFPEVDIDLV